MDIAKIRADTLGCADKIFLNSAGASLMSQTVVGQMTDYLKLEEQFGGYEVANTKTAEINAFYSETGTLLHCPPKHIAFMYNATDAYSKALSAIPFAAGDSILTTNDDYISNHIAFLSLQKRLGIKIWRTKNLPNGDIDFNDFEQLAKTHRPKLVAITHVPTNSGLVQDAETAGAICSQYGIWYLLDACQSIGQLEVDVQKIKCDFLSATGRKFLRGPRGTGFLYVSNRVIDEKLEPLFIDMRGAEWTSFDTYEVQMSATRFEEWEFSYTGLVGLTEAVRYANDIGLDAIQAYNKVLAQKLRANLAQIPRVKVLDRGGRLSSIVTFHLDGIALEPLCLLLKQHTVRHSVTHKQHARFDLSDKGVDWVIRFSPHYFNTLEEIEQASAIVGEIAANLD